MISSLRLPSVSSLAKSPAQYGYRCLKQRLRSTVVPTLLFASQKPLESRSIIKTLPPFLQCQQLQQLPSLALAGGTLALSLAVIADPAVALELHMEPSNALSLPTWAVHTSSVLEWLAGMGLFWRYGEVSGNARWKGMTWGMLPCLGSAMCACTWHFFYNAPELEFLVTLQAGLTVLGNLTLWAAAYRIYEGAQTEGT